MAINQSLYLGVPTTLGRGLEQFEQLKKELEWFVYYGEYLVLIHQTKGKYAGCYTNWTYKQKPKGKYIKIYKIPNKSTKQERRNVLASLK